MGQSISNGQDSFSDMKEVRVEGLSTECAVDPRSPSGVIRRTPLRLDKTKRPPLRDNLPDPRSPTEEISRTPIAKESETQRNFDGVQPQRLFVFDNDAKQQGGRKVNNPSS